MADAETSTSLRGRTTVHTACPLDCPDCCSLSITVDRGRVRKIDGNRVAPSTEGYICGKVRRFDRRLYGPDRLLYPAVRKGPKGSGQFSRVTWDEALDLIAEKMRAAREAHGAESVLPYHYGGSNGLLTNDLEDARFFRRFGASRLARTLCAAPTGFAATQMYGKMAGVAYPDYAEARLIVVWGCNPSASGIHLVSHIKQAQKNGAKLVVIDPRRTPLAGQADLHIAVQPGTDVVVALAMIRELFAAGRADLDFLAEHTTGSDALRAAADGWTFERAADVAGVPVAQLRTLSEWYCTIAPAVIRCGWGQERNRNGAASTMAILALPAVANKFGVRGGGYTMSNSGAWGITAEKLIGVPGAGTRVVNMNQLGRALTEFQDPPVAVLFSYNCNPVATVPDQNRVVEGLMRGDLFTVVFEQAMTDTASYADVVLPATTFLEHYDVSKGYGAYHFHLTQPVIAAVGESRPNHEVFRDLSVRLGLVEPLSPEEDLGEAGAVMEVAAHLPRGLGAALMEQKLPEAPGDGRPIQFVDVRPKTEDGLIHLFPMTPERAPHLYAFTPDPATEKYPLSLISPASPHTISSTLGEFRPRIARMKIHPDDAHPRGIADDDRVRIFNDLGDVHCEALVTPEVRPGTLSLPKGLWARSTFNGETATALAPDTLEPLSGGACFNDARVQVELLAQA
jgi:anaerobic selenocysteine-containing dehydrogenase